MTSQGQAERDTENSVGRNSIIMASGTAASRVTGQIRTILLAAAIGTTGIAADAYQTGAMIPQVMFTLISGGIFNAVLVPQIVRTLKEEDAKDRLDKLITASIVLLLGLTLVLMLGTSALTSIYLNSKWNPAQRALANAFTLWCMPQVFFYGLYTVLGQILAAKGRFTAYAWSSVGANIISCAGFIMFIAMFGNAQRQSIDFWTTGKIGLTAGAWTLGVAFQALMLFIPLIRSGFTYKPKWGIQGIGLRSMGPVAAWSLGVVIVDQLANIVNARITNGAPLEGNPFDIAGNGSYQNAYTLYMLPYSLIAVSVSTAIFPQLSQAVAEGRINDARDTLSRSLRNVGLMMCFFGIVMLVIPVPIIRALLPSVNVHESVLISGPLLGLTVGLAAVSAFLLIQRTFYAFEDGKQPFIFAAFSNTIQVVMVLIAVRVAPPQYWTAFVGLSMALSNIVSFPVLVHMLKQRFDGFLDGKRIGLTYAKAVVAAAVSGGLALLIKNPVTHLVGAQVTNRDGHMSWLQAVLICIIITLVIAAVYCIVLYALHTQELINFIAVLAQRLGLSIPDHSQKDQTQASLPNVSIIADVEAREETIAHRAARVVRSYTEPAASDEMEGALEQIENSAMADAGSMNPRVFNQSVRIAPKSFPHQTLQNPTGIHQGADSPTNVPAQPQNPEPTQTPHGAHTSVQTDSQAAQAHGRRVQGSPQSPGTIRPKVSDILLNRYQLRTLLKQEPGMSAWEVEDKVLDRRSQLFIVTDNQSVNSVNTASADLALSSSRRFTPVYQLHTRDRISLIVCDLDAGSSLENYLNTPPMHTPSYEAIRTIIGESAQALGALYKLGLHTLTVSPSLIRLSPTGITIADAPVLSMIEPWQIGDTKDTSGSEGMVVRQLSGMLYALLVGSIPGSTPNSYPSLEALPEGIPKEFRIICMRGLRLPTTDGVSPIPLITLAELSALLGPWTPPEELTDQDMVWPKPDQQASIQAVTLQAVPPEHVLSIPSSVRPNDALAKNTTVEPKWGTNQLLFPESSEVEMLNLSNSDTDLFSIFDQRRVQNQLPSANRISHQELASWPTQAVDVSSVRQPTIQAHPSSPGVEQSPSPDQNKPAPTPPDSVRDSNDNTELNVPVDDLFTHATETVPESETQVLPPSFSPSPQSRLASGMYSERNQSVEEEFDEDDLDDNVADAQLFGHYTTRSIVIAIAAGLVVIGLIWASTTVVGRLHGHIDAGNPWPNMSAAPLPGDNTNENAATPPIKHQPKEAGAVPPPKPLPANTTAYPTARQLFMNHPAGLDGVSWYVHLDAPHDVSRVVISIRQHSGQGQIFANATGSQPTPGTAVAQFAFDPSGTTEVRLQHPIHTQDLVIWVPTSALPQEGTLHFNNVTVY